MRHTRDNPGCVFALVLFVFAYGLFAIAFQTAVVGGSRASSRTYTVYGWPAVWQGVSMLVLSGSLLAYELLAAEGRRLRAGKVGLFGFVVFIALQVVSSVSQGNRNEEKRRERQEKLEKYMNDPETKRRQEELTRQWIDNVRQQARSATPPVPTGGK